MRPSASATRRHPPPPSTLLLSLPRWTPALQYDQDVTTWSPQGRIFQIEYAMEAVKQGSAAVGLKVGALLLPPSLASTANLHPTKCRAAAPGEQATGGRVTMHVGCRQRRRSRLASIHVVQSGEHAVLATIKRAPSDLSSYQRKVRPAGLPPCLSLLRALLSPLEPHKTPAVSSRMRLHACCPAPQPPLPSASPPRAPPGNHARHAASAPTGAAPPHAWPIVHAPNTSCSGLADLQD